MYSGVCSWYTGDTNGSDEHEILFNTASHTTWNIKISARILNHKREHDDQRPYCSLQLSSSSALNSANWTFKFKKIIDRW